MESSNGKLLVYASSFLSDDERFKFVSLATEKMAKLLKLGFEIVVFKEEVSPIYVYYKSGDGDPIPLYCDKEGHSDMRDIYAALRNMMFVLSFHPKYSALRQMRTMIMRFS